MSRKPQPHERFTRFTSTSPHATSQPYPSFTSSSNTASTITTDPSSPSFSRPSPTFNHPSPDGETPAQKVARLRSAHLQQKSSTLLTPADRFLARSRIYADFLHRGALYTLIGLTGAGVAITFYSLISIVSHNRRQKKSWIDAQLDKLDDARSAFLEGSASAEQLHLLEQERAGEAITRDFEERQRRKKEDSIWGKVKGTFGILSKGGDLGRESEVLSAQERVQKGRRLLEDSASRVEGEVTPTTRMVVPEGMRLASVSDSGIRGVGIDEMGRPVPAGKLVRSTPLVDGVERERNTGKAGFERIMPAGSLDVMADNVVSGAVGGDQGWLSWIRGGSKS